MSTPVPKTVCLSAAHTTRNSKRRPEICVLSMQLRYACLCRHVRSTISLFFKLFRGLKEGRTNVQVHCVCVPSHEYQSNNGRSFFRLLCDQPNPFLSQCPLGNGSI